MDRALTVIFVALALGACTEKNFYFPENGALAGYIRPAVEGASIRLLDGSISTTARDDGFFIIESIPAGVHDIVIEAQGFSRRVLHSVTVAAAQTRSLGTVTLSNLPYPIFRSLPENGDEEVQVSLTFGVSCDERLDLESLNLLATVTPPLAGTWTEYEPQYYEYAPLYYRYTFHSEGVSLSLHTEYTVTIPVSVKTLRGVPLDHPAVIRFTTEPLSAGINVRTTGNPPFVPIGQFDMTVSFNAPVHIDSLRKAVTIQPPVEGVWNPASGAAIAYVFKFEEAYHGILKPNTQYAVVISDGINLSGQLRLPQSALRLFTTGAFEVDWTVPGMGRPVDPEDTITVRFNTPADTMLTPGAISIQRLDGEPEILSMRWDDSEQEVYISADHPWEQEAIYKLKITRDAAAQDGVPLAFEFVSYFYVR